jgi:hypothetical protein
LTHYVADGLTLLAAANPHRLNQFYREVDREHGFGFWHWSQLQMALRLQQIAVGLAARNTVVLD